MDKIQKYLKKYLKLLGYLKRQYLLQAFVSIIDTSKFVLLI